MQKVLIVGGTGYIGSHVAVELFEAGFEPVIIDNFSNSEKAVIANLEGLSGQKVKCYEQDFADARKLSVVLETEKPIGVIHFAASKAVGESVENPLKYYRNNVSGFVSLLEMLDKYSIANFIFSSSAAVYGEPPTDRVTEEIVCNPTSPYGQSKLMDEIILRDYCQSNNKIKGIALRYFNVVGGHPSGQIGELPKGKPNNLLPIIVQAVAGKIPPLTVYGDDYDTPDGTCLRDYIHVVDLARAHVQALQYALKKDSGFYEVLNVGSGQPTSVLELIHKFEKLNKVKVPYSIGPRRAGDPTAYFAVPDKINHLLGWQSELTIDDAVRSAWAWQQKLGKK